MDVMDFLQSWYFMGTMAVLPCSMILFIPLGIVLVILFISRANRKNGDEPDRAK